MTVWNNGFLSCQLMHQPRAEERSSPASCLSFGISSANFFGSILYMNATECNRSLENKPPCLYLHIGSTVVFIKLAWRLSYSNHKFFRLCVCVNTRVCSSIILHFHCSPLEMNSLCTLRQPGGITLIKPNTWCVIAFSFIPDSKANRSSLLHIYNVTRGVPINCPRLRLQNIPRCLTPLQACVFPSHSLGSHNTSIMAPSNRLSRCNADSEAY